MTVSVMGSPTSKPDHLQTEPRLGSAQLFADIQNHMKKITFSSVKGKKKILQHKKSIVCFTSEEKLQLSLPVTPSRGKMSTLEKCRHDRADGGTNSGWCPFLPLRVHINDSPSRLTHPRLFSILGEGD